MPPDTFFTPEVVQALLQAGGVPALILFGVWKLWNGTGRRVERVEERVQKIHDAVVRIEARIEARDIQRERETA